MLRPTTFEIDLDAAAHNVRVVREMVGPARKIYAVIKADGYGHGAVEMGETFLAHGADALGVADLGEGIRLRRRGITAPILVYPNSLPEAAGETLAHGLTPTVVDLESARACAAAARGPCELLHRQLGERGREQLVLCGSEDACPGVRPGLQLDASQQRRPRAEMAVERRPRDACPIRDDRHRRTGVARQDIARRGHHLAPDGRIRGEGWHAVNLDVTPCPVKSHGVANHSRIAPATMSVTIAIAAPMRNASNVR